MAVAHVTQCPYCIKGHTRAALRYGATPRELMEAIWVAAEMRAGGAFAHSTVALTEIEEAAKQNAGRRDGQIAEQKRMEDERRNGCSDISATIRTS